MALTAKEGLKLMKILAFDGTAKAASVAVTEGERILAQSLPESGGAVRASFIASEGNG